jgi:hypothetical protein
MLWKDVLAAAASSESLAQLHGPRDTGALCRYYLRAEMACVGLHFPPVAGIDYVTSNEVPAGCPQARLPTDVSTWNCSGSFL